MAWTVPIFLERTFCALDAMAADSLVQTATGKDNTILVVLQLAGGNDGLNTLVPYSDDAYYRVRPKIAIPANSLHKLNDHCGLHPQLKGLKALYDEGHLSVIQGVGYPNPNRSHFRSTEIWQTAVDSNKTDTNGWLGRYFDSCCNGEDPAVGISIGNQAPQAFAAKVPRGISFARPEEFRFDLRQTAKPKAANDFFRSANDVETMDGSSIGMLQGPNSSGGETLDFLHRTALDATLSSDKIMELVKKSKSASTYPSNRLGDSLNLVGRLIAGGMSTRVYYVAHGGFDTHSNQLPTHERLMTELDASLSAFAADLKAQGNFDRVLIMTFSEFGRRVAQNNSNGTDHGAAAPMFIAGGAIKAGVHGAAPSLTNLHDGDLIHTVDFRSVYASVLENWLHAPVEPILKRKFSTLPFV